MLVWFRHAVLGPSSKKIILNILLDDICHEGGSGASVIDKLVFMILSVA